MRRRTVVISVSVVVVLLALGIFVYSFTNIGRPSDTCPPTLVGSGYASEGPMPFRIEAIGSQVGVITGTAQFHGYSGSGVITWCIFDNSGLLKGSLQTDRIMGQVAASADGQYVAVAGFEIAPGPAGRYTNGAVYLFDKSGTTKWEIASASPIFSIGINDNGSVIVANDQELLYLNGGGRVLWNYSKFASMTAALIDDGSRVVAGVNGFSNPGGSYYGSALIMFDAHGHPLWNVSIPEGTFDSGSSLAVTNGLIAAGVSTSGVSGTLLCFNLQGSAIWSRHIDSAILNVNFEANGSTILAVTNWGQVSFNTSGNVIENQTSPH